MKKQYHKIFSAALINLFIFSVILFFLHPVYNTEEDVYVLYHLSGAFGEPPTELLHYNNGLHPLLGMIVKNLFLLTGLVNWYSVLLLLAHYAACTIILLLIWREKPTILFFMACMVLFVVFEGWFLMELNFTNTSVVLGCTALLMIFTAHRQGKPIKWQLAAAVAVLLTASFFRIHVLLPVAGVALPFLLFSPPAKAALINFATLVAAAGIIFLFNQAQQSYYKAYIPGWQQEETYRQEIYSFYNNNHLKEPAEGQQWATEYRLLRDGLPVDTGYLSGDKLRNMFADLNQPQKAAGDTAKNQKNWAWTNNRVFFLAMVSLLPLFPFKKRNILVATGALGCMVLGLLYLHVNLKLPGYIFISCLFMLGLLMVVSPGKTPAKRKSAQTMIVGAMLLSVAWGCVRLYKINQINTAGNQRFKSAYAEIAANPSKLFVIAGDGFPLQKFYIFDNPGKWMLTNYMGSEHFLQNRHQAVLKRFGIANFDSVPHSDRILFWGKEALDLRAYFLQATGKSVSVSGPLNYFKQGAVYQIGYDTLQPPTAVQGRGN